MVSAILEACGINYKCTYSYGLALSLDKAITKLIAEKIGVKTPKYVVFYDYEYYSGVDEITAELSNLKFPIIVKPNTEGNSSGIKVFDKANAAAAYKIEIKNKYQTSVICEEFIFGKEITVPVIGNDEKDALWCVTTVDIQRNSSEWLDVNAKMNVDYNNIILDLPSYVEKAFKTAVFKLFKAIGCCDFVRFDFRLSDDNEVYFIEVNPLPALFYGGSFCVLGQQYGLNYRETLRLLINTAADRLSIPKI